MLKGSCKGMKRGQKQRGPLCKAERARPGWAHHLLTHSNEPMALHLNVLLTGRRSRSFAASTEPEPGLGGAGLGGAGTPGVPARSSRLLTP